MIVSLDPWDENGPMKIYEKIKKGLILFPKNINKNLNNFIQYLLIGVPNKRMGTFLNDKQKKKRMIIQWIKIIEVVTKKKLKK